VAQREVHRGHAVGGGRAREQEEGKNNVAEHLVMTHSRAENTENVREVRLQRRFRLQIIMAICDNIGNGRLMISIILTSYSEAAVTVKLEVKGL
jgi:hypothetical protein